MAKSATLLSFNHMNQVTPPDYQAVWDHYTAMFDGGPLLKGGDNGFVNPFLMDVGGAIMEYFVPVNMGTGMGKQFTQKGGFLHGVEFRVPNLDEAKEIMEANGVRTVIDSRPDFIMTRPSDCLGICFELYEGDFYSAERGARYITPLRPQSWWADEHPLGVTGFGFSVAVKDLDAAVARLAQVCGAKEKRRERRPDANAEVAVMGVANIDVELTAATGPGPVADFLARYGELPRAFQFKVKDAQAAGRFFAERGVTLEPGDQASSLIFPPARNFDVRYEFTAG